MDFGRLNPVILDLYQAEREVPFDRFQNAALLTIGTLIPFDSAWWGTAAAEPQEIHRLYLHNCDASILEGYLPHQPHDFMREALMASPGRTINLSDLTTRARLVRTELYKNWGRHYRIEWSMGTLLIEPVSSLMEFLTIWRHDPKRRFADAERQAKELLMPHVAAAHRMSRLRHMLNDPRANALAWAIADERGFLRDASPRFVHWLREHSPSWRGSRLPAELLAAVSEVRPASLGGQRLDIEVRDDFRLLQVKARSVLDVLTSREQEIAERYAGGETYAVISAALGLSPATVRNHIAHCFRKLGVTNKAGLVRRVMQDSA